MTLTLNSKLVKRVAKRLEEGAETPEALAKEVLEMVDDVHVVVCQYGTEDGKCWYVAQGLYSTRKQAAKAAASSPLIGHADHVAVVPLLGHESVQAKLDELNKSAGQLKVTDVKGRLAPHTDPHFDSVDELLILDKKTMTWKTVYKKRRR